MADRRIVMYRGEINTILLCLGAGCVNGLAQGIIIIAVPAQNGKK
jgi:hypothetical protein